MHPRGSRFLVLVAATALLARGAVRAGSLEPPGPPAPTMKTLAQVEPRTPLGTTGPIVIEASGSYYLTGDLTSALKGIQILANDVTVDLNGFTLVGDGSHDGVEVYDATNVLVRNGRIRGFNRGVLVRQNSLGVRIEELRIVDSVLSGIFINANARDVAVERCDLSRNGAHGVHAFSGDQAVFLNAPVWIKDNRIYDNAFSGIVIQKVVGFVEGNRVFGNDLHGIDVDEGEAYVQNNRVHRNLLNGIQFVGDSLGYAIDNEVWGNGQVGILDTTGPGARIARNLLGFNDLTNYDIDAVGVAAPESPLSGGPDGWDNVE